MKHSRLTLLIALSLLILVGCDDFKLKEGLQKTEPPSDVVPKSEDSNPYQIGKTWDRTQFEPDAQHPYQVLMMNRTGLGDVGVGVYLGVADGRHIVMTAAHLFPELVNCATDVSFGIESTDDYHYFPCGGWSFKLTENDIMFFEVDPEVEVDLLVPLKITNEPIEKHQPLTLMSVQRNFETNAIEWHKDTSNECLVISDEMKSLKDPDTKDVSEIQSWSVAMGCDGMHGDSGSPVLNAESELLGLLWTGKYPKDEGSRDITTDDPFKVWNNFNYFVPVEKIKAELDAAMTSDALILSDKVVLEQILKEFF